MTQSEKITQGTTEWFHMIGRILTDAAEKADLPSDMNLSFVERYTDGDLLEDGLVQGIRLDFTGGKPSYRIGAYPDERGDINVEVTSHAARQLNLHPDADPEYERLHRHFRETGEWKADGDLARLGDWLAATHDPIVARTK